MFSATRFPNGVNIRKGDIYLTLTHGHILRIMRQGFATRKVYLNTFRTLAHDYYYNTASYAFEHKFIITSLSGVMTMNLTREEWESIVGLCGYPSLPYLEKNVCTLCDQDVGTSLHTECDLNKVAKIFLLTNYGWNLTCCFVNFLRELLEKDAMRCCPLHTDGTVCTQLCCGSIIDIFTFCRMNTMQLVENTSRQDFYDYMAYDPLYIRPTYFKPDCPILRDDASFNAYRLTIMSFLLDQLELYYKPELQDKYFSDYQSPTIQADEY